VRVILYWLTVGLAIPTAGFLMRIFIISHDCGHGSFVSNKRARDILGFVSAALTFTPYFYWGHRHAIHHATSGNLDKRGIGDVWTLTLKEYQEGSFMLKLKFRLVRNPITMLIVGPIYMFLIFNRFAGAGSSFRWHLSVFWTNLAIAATAGTLIWFIGFQAYLAIQLPIILTAGITGVWLFYVQHQYEDIYWERQENFDYFSAALKGSSYYKLPKILQWFSGNIGFHHVHHLSPLIPNYYLEKCNRENPLFEVSRVITVKQSFKTMQLRVWDEDNRKMVGLGLF
jgi:omega-6 fatty acid desaturase (delta-12 desaturase)